MENILVYSYKIYKNINDIEDIINTLYKDNKVSYCQSFYWLKYITKFYTDNFCKKLFFGTVVFIVINRNDKNVLVAPLLIKEKDAALVGYKAPSDYLNFVYGNDLIAEDFEYLFSVLRTIFKIRTIDCGICGDVNSFLLNTLKNVNGISLRTEKSCNVQLDNNFEEYELYFKSLSKSVRQNYRTAINRMNTDGKKMEY